MQFNTFSMTNRYYSQIWNIHNCLPKTPVKVLILSKRRCSNLDYRLFDEQLCKFQHFILIEYDVKNKSLLFYQKFGIYRILTLPKYCPLLVLIFFLFCQHTDIALKELFMFRDYP